jgi:raffinose/stachyose/melibiose transport system permease protein
MKRFKNPFSPSDLLLLPLCAVMIYPFYFLLISTFKTLREVSYNPTAFPQSFYLNNYLEVFQKTPVVNAFFNTLLLAVLGVVVIVVVGEMAAYPIVFNENMLNNGLMVYLMIGFLVPFQSILLSLFEVMQKLGLIDRLGGMILFYSNGSALRRRLWTGPASRASSSASSSR